MFSTPRHTLAAMLVVAVVAPAAQAAEAAKPNIVYIMSDELAYYELSYMGSPLIKTPNLDALAAEGIQFTQALAGSSVCAPTRCCLMTGKHSGHTSVRKNDGGTPMRAGEETIASMLRTQGYATGGFGKWGCGGRGSTGVPEEHGFDVFVGYYDQVHAHSFFPAYIIRNSQELVLPGNRGGTSGPTYSQYVIMEHAQNFLRENKDRPFFLYLPITPPHGMYNIPDDDPAWALYKDEPWSEDARRYAAMVTMVDRQVRDIVDMLQEFGLDENTLLFFCGDNGGQDRFRDAEHPRGFFGPNVHPTTGVEFRGGKGSLYEGGLRIPAFARRPGHIKPGQTSDLAWYFPDVLPTVAEAVGFEYPHEIDGISILPELLGEDAVGRKQPTHEYLYWELGGQTAVRLEDWKAVRPRENGQWELYDLSSDISEEHNVADANPDVMTRIRAIVLEAHEPAEEGTFTDRIAHERDRQAKWGDTRAAASANKPVNTLPAEGLLANKAWKLVRVSSESTSNNRHARHAIDGDPRTVWHTQFMGKLEKHPHELVIDLGAQRTIRGFRYLARQDGGWNGAVADCEFFVSDSPDEFGEPAVKTTLKKTQQPQEATCDAVQGRYILFRVLSEVNSGPWASAAELGVIGE